MNWILYLVLIQFIFILESLKIKHHRKIICSEWKGKINQYPPCLLLNLSGWIAGGLFGSKRWGRTLRCWGRRGASRPKAIRSRSRTEVSFWNRSSLWFIFLVFMVKCFERIQQDWYWEGFGFFWSLQGFRTYEVLKWGNGLGSIFTWSLMNFSSKTALLQTLCWVRRHRTSKIAARTHHFSGREGPWHFSEGSVEWRFTCCRARWIHRYVPTIAVDTV